jgi:hypothetical protein
MGKMVLMQSLMTARAQIFSFAIALPSQPNIGAFALIHPEIL